MKTRTPSLRTCLGVAVALALLAVPAGAEVQGVRIAQADPGATDESAQAPAPTPPSDGPIEEIVVLGAESDASADFAAGDSVTGFGAEDLAALGAQSIADLASFTPNLEIVTSGATTPTFFIRGVGLNDFNPNSTGAVAVYQDDVAINAPAIQLGSLFDVEAVNVLRGPQGTGLARNASAGAIKIYGRKPTGEFGGYLRADFGNFNLQDYEGAIEAPIYEDLLAGRFAFRLAKRDGTMKNRCASALPFPPGHPKFAGGSGPFRVKSEPDGRTTSLSQGPWSQCGEPVAASGFFGDSFSDVPVGLEEDINDTDNWAARGTLLFQPTLDTSFYLNGHGSRRDEFTRLGQAIGTSGVFCTDPTKICTNPSSDFSTSPPTPIPPEQFDRSVAQSGLLGGSQRATTNLLNGYQPREIRARLAELAPCLVAINPANACNRQSTATRLAANRAKILVAEELAERLDDEPWEGDFNHVGDTTNDTWGTHLKGEIALPWGLELKAISAFDTYERSIDTDLDFSPETLFHIKTEDEGLQFYEDLSLSGYVGETGLTWEIGGWYLHEELDVVVTNDFGTTIAASLGVLSREFDQSLDSAAGYASFSFDFWDDFTLDGGYRYNWEQKEFNMRIQGGVATEPDNCSRQVGTPFVDCQIDEVWNASTGTIRLLYRFREDTHVSWRYTRGWKPGSFNATASQFTGPTVAEPEELDAFEFGLHGSWFDGRVGLDGSLFYYAYSDYQIFTARQFLGGTPEFVLLNANDAEVYGSEIDALARPWDGAFVNARFSWLETQFLDFLRRDQFLRSGGQGSPVAFRDTQASGRPLLNSPQFKISMTAEQTLPLGRYGSFTVRYDGVWTDTTFFDASKGRGIGDSDGNLFLPDDTIAQQPYWLHNARVSWRPPDGSFEIAGWVRNIENTPYKTFAFDGSTFQATTIYFVGDPRTYGVSLMMNF